MLVDLGPAKKKDTGLVDLGPAPTPITEAMKALEAPLTGQDVPEEYRRMGVKEYRPPETPIVSAVTDYRLPTIADPQGLPQMPVVAPTTEFPRPFDPEEPPSFKKPGIAYPLAETLFARPYLAAAEAAVPGARKLLLGIGARTPEEREQVWAKAEEIEKMPWYKKLPEAYGWGVEKVIEYKVLKSIFKALGLTKALGFVGNKVASKITSRELTKLGGKTALLKAGGWETFRQNVLQSMAKTAPENMAFLSVWSMSEAARRGQPLAPAAYRGARFGLIFSLGIPLLTEGAKVGLNTKVVERAMLKIQAKHPKLADYLAGKPEKEFIDAALESMADEARAAGETVPQDITFTNLSKPAKNIVKAMARQYKKNWIKIRQRDIAAQRYWAAGKAPVTAEARQAAAVAEMDAELAEIQKPAAVKPLREPPKKPTVAPPVQKVAPEAKVVPPKAAAKPEAKVAKPKLVDLGPAKEKPNVLMLTEVQKILDKKAFISEKGKIRPGARLLAKQFIGKTDIHKMTEDELAKFGQLLKRLPEPRLVHGRLVPPSIPRTTALTKARFFERRFKRPTPVMFITDQSYYAEKLGVKSIVEPLEKAKVRFDLEYRSAAHELDKQGKLIDKVGKTTTKERVAAKVKNIPTKAKEDMGNLLDSYEEPPANLDPKKKEIFNWFRRLTRTMLAKQNEARAKLDIPLIKGRKAYMRHIATDTAREMLAGRYPFPEGIKFWSGLSSGKKIFNPMEFQRKLEEDVYGLFTKDPVYASKAMMYNALKEIHLTQPLKFFNAQMAAVGKDLPEYKNLSPEQRRQLQASVIPASTRRWLIDYVRTVIKGQQTQTDEWVNNLVTQTGLRGLINKALHPFGRTVSQKPITHFFQTTGRMQMAGVIGTRPKLIIRNKFQLTHNLGLYTIKANARAFLPPSSQLKKLLDESLFLKSYTGLEELPADLAKKVEKIWHKGYQWSAISNARQAMECAYWDTLELIENPKYKNVGFADPKRTYKEPHEHLYPSEKQKILKEMEFGASATQFHYIAMGMPQVFRHKSLIPFTRLTSWWMNYYAKFHREAIHRGLSGNPSWDTDIKLPWSRRLGWLRYVVLGGLILNTLGYTRSYLFGAAPTGWPPAIQFAGNLYLYLITLGSDDKWKQSKNKLAKKRMLNALKTFIPGYIAYKDVEAIWSGRKDLSSLFFYKKYKKKQEGKRPKTFERKQEGTRKKRFEREKKMLRKEGFG